MRTIRQWRTRLQANSASRRSACRSRMSRRLGSVRHTAPGWCRVPLEDVEKAWQRPAHGPRLVLTIAPGEATWTNERRAVRYKATGENTGRESEKRRYSIRERLWK